MAWSKLEVTLPEDVGQPLVDLIEKLKQFLQTQVDLLEAFLTVAGAVPDPLALLLEALIDKLNETVEGLLEDLGGYALYVPVRKRLMTNFLGLGDITPNWAGELGLFGEPDSAIKYDDPALNEFLVNANRYNGGNFGFFRTVVESLYDEGDLNRPQFLDDDDYIGGLTLVVGTAFDPLGLLDDIWKLLSMFQGPDTIPKFPRPQNLRGRAVSTLNTGRFSALLNWDAPEVPVYHLEDFGGTFYFPYRYAIIRGKNTTGALSATSVIDLMGKRDIAVGDTFRNGDMEVIVEDEFDLSKISYLDEDIPAEDGDAFYYAVAWRLRGFGPDEVLTQDGGRTDEYWYISNVVRLTPYPILPASTPPDWYRTPSIAQLFPPFAEVLRKLVAQLENATNKVQGNIQMYKDYVAFLKRELLRYERIVNEILDAIAELAARFDLPTSGVYLRTWKGQGGNTFFVTDMARGFTEDDAPPFNDGDEFVAGAVLLAGGPELVVDALLAAYGLFFGADPEDGTAEMLEQVGEQVTLLEEQYFGPDMEPTDEPPEEPVLDDSLSVVSCKGPQEPTTEEFGPNMEPIDASS